MKTIATDIIVLFPMLAWIGLCPGPGLPPHLQFQENQAPVVSILEPKGSPLGPNSRIRYSIAVSDKEDGESKYDEIAGSEVVLEVRFVPNSGMVPDVAATSVTEKGLLGVASSNCLYCHAFRGNLIGPSFYEIGAKYKQTGPDMGEITNRILSGSTGNWGDKVMPSHPELAPEEVAKMLEWIGNYATREDIQYYHGLEGSIDLPPDAVSGDSGGHIVLTAAYRDHGSDDAPKKTGTDQVVLALAK